ncbi:hypothetical protein COO60DRAFT_1059693 [Scenedesmus sp. NREL 46B-D3]|nr:hypothetical protein COO60DRAFT_1059693 [Scenedesmus sp. NREL 46B-D3]
MSHQCVTARLHTNTTCPLQQDVQAYSDQQRMPIALEQPTVATKVCMRWSDKTCLEHAQDCGARPDFAMPLNRTHVPLCPPSWPDCGVSCSNRQALLVMPQRTHAKTQNAAMCRSLRQAALKLLCTGFRASAHTVPAHDDNEQQHTKLDQGAHVGAGTECGDCTAFLNYMPKQDNTPHAVRPKPLPADVHALAHHSLGAGLPCSTLYWRQCTSPTRTRQSCMPPCSTLAIDSPVPTCCRREVHHAPEPDPLSHSRAADVNTLLPANGG